MRKLFISLLIVTSLISCTSKDNTSFDVKFGILEVKDGAGIFKKETRTLPLITKDEGQFYGIYISPPNNEPYNCYIIAYLPGTPKMLSGTVKDIDSSKVTKGLRSPTEKAMGIYILPMWFDEGDPLGKYKLELYINDKLYETIEFEAIEYNGKKT